MRKRKRGRDSLYADAMAILTDAIKPVNEDRQMSDAMPKKWMNTKCAQCEHFWAYPVGNEHGEDWTWECESLDLEEAPDDLVGANEDCEGFFPAPMK